MAALNILSRTGLLLTPVCFALIFIMALLITRKRLGQIPPHSHDFRTIFLGIISVIWVIICIACAVFPELTDYLGFLPFLADFGVSIIGIMLCFIASLLILAGFMQMGVSFRMGIPPEEEEPAPLVTKGVFKHIRNPGFFGLDIAGLGTLLLAPTTTLVILVSLVWITFHLQIKQEEKYLLTKYGNIYKSYMMRTGRYLPKIRKKAIIK